MLSTIGTTGILLCLCIMSLKQKKIIREELDKMKSRIERLKKIDE